MPKNTEKNYTTLLNYLSSGATKEVHHVTGNDGANNRLLFSKIRFTRWLFILTAIDPGRRIRTTYYTY